MHPVCLSVSSCVPSEWLGAAWCWHCAICGFAGLCQMMVWYTSSSLQGWYVSQDFLTGDISYRFGNQHVLFGPPSATTDPYANLINRCSGGKAETGCVWTAQFQQTKQAKHCQMSSKTVSSQTPCRLNGSDGSLDFQFIHMSVIKEEGYILVYL